MAENREEEIIVDEDRIRDGYADDPAGTVVGLADRVERLRRQVQQLAATVDGLYSVLREVAPDKLSRYELKQEIRRFMASQGEEE